MKQRIFYMQILIVIALNLFHCSHSLFDGGAQKPINFILTRGFRCVTQTGIETAIRLNINNEVECWSENRQDCTWSLNSEKQCLNTIDPKNHLKLNSVECGISHQKLYGTNGYDNKGHWCNKGLIYFFERYHCPNETGLKVAVIMDKKTGEIKCLSKNLTDCYQGKDLQELCEFVNKCKENKRLRAELTNSKTVTIADPMIKKPKTGNIGCESNLRDKLGHVGYQAPGRHWCKEALAYFRYNGEWLVNSQTKMKTIVRLGEKGDIECLSQDGKTCVKETGGDLKMRNLIDNLTNGGKNKPKVVSCGKKATGKDKSGFEDEKSWCYKAYFTILGKSRPKPKPDPKEIAKKIKDIKNKKEDKKGNGASKDNSDKDKKGNNKKGRDAKNGKSSKDKGGDKKDIRKPKVNTLKDLTWRGSVFGPDKNGFFNNGKSGNFYKPEDTNAKKDQIPKEKDKGKDPEIITDPGWRAEGPMKVDIDKLKKEVTNTWRGGLNYLKFNTGKSPINPNVNPRKIIIAKVTPAPVGGVVIGGNVPAKPAPVGRIIGGKVLRPQGGNVPRPRDKNSRGGLNLHLKVNTGKSPINPNVNPRNIIIKSKVTPAPVGGVVIGGNVPAKPAPVGRIIGGKVLRPQGGNVSRPQDKNVLIPQGGNAPRSTEVYEIVSTLSGLCFEVKGNSNRLGANIIQSPCNHRPHQRFEVIFI